MKKVVCLFFLVSLFVSCASLQLHKEMTAYVLTNDAVALAYTIEHTAPEQLKKTINRQDNTGRTLLHKAIALEEVDIVKSLLNAGADRMIANTQKLTAVDYAKNSRSKEIREAFGFYEKRSEPSEERSVSRQNNMPQPKREVPESKPAQSYQPVFGTHYTVVLGADNSEFLKAVWEQDYAKVNNLLKLGKNVNETDIHGNNALFYALVNSNNAILNLLLSYGINPNQKNKHGQLPFLFAVDRNNVSSVSALLDSGANINQTDVQGVNAVMLAVLHRRVSLLKLLHTKNASLSGTDSLGNTLLHIAIKNEDVIITRYLLEQGCDVYTPNTNGVKPLELLQTAKREEFRIMAKKYE